MSQNSTSTVSETAELRSAGLKATIPRLRILAVLEQNRKAHMSAEDVYQALMNAGDDVGLATVYRVLTQFEAAGLVIRHNFAEGRAVYERIVESDPRRSLTPLEKPLPVESEPETES